MTGPVSQSILQQKRAEILRLAQDHGASVIRLFGSRARGDAGVGSDIDLLVRMEPHRTLLDLIGLTQNLEALLGVSLDVVSEGGLLSSYLRDRILAEAVAL